MTERDWFPELPYEEIEIEAIIGPDALLADEHGLSMFEPRKKSRKRPASAQLFSRYSFAPRNPTPTKSGTYEG